MTGHQQAEQSAAAPVFGGSEIKKLGYNLYLRIPDNRLECRCSYVPHEQGSMMSRDDLTSILKQYNVQEGIDQQAFEDFCIKAAAGQQLVDMLLASGTPPVHGKDEFISLMVHPSVVVRKGEDDSTNVDMHIVQTFLNVSAGDVIGRIIPAEPGTPGKNISGMIIPSHPGKKMKCKVGKNICLEENGTLLVAAAAGRFCQSSEEVSVEHEYLVKGNVNFRIGSINFIGVVEIRGDVMDNFDVTASKGLMVTGNIGACNIVSDGDISFCGMNGLDRGRIICGGTLRAHYIHDVVVECKGDVIVDVEIHNCIIKTLGRIIVDKGAISGGSYIALGGIEAKKLGSASSQRTELRAGVDCNEAEVLDKLMVTLDETQNKLDQSQSPSEIKELQHTVSVLADSIMVIRGKTEESANAKINVKSVLYENVHLSLGCVTETVREQKDGSHSIIENSIEGGLRYLSLTGLNVNAGNMERAFVLEQENELLKVNHSGSE
jgi:uncharacterized protein (DUF342 family)